MHTLPRFFPFGRKPIPSTPLSFIGIVLAAASLLISQFACAQTRYSIVLSEIMADPTPAIGLPNAEWVELKNTTLAPINLHGYRLQKPGNNPSGPMPAFLLNPGSSVIVCTASQVPSLSVFGNAISITNFPSLGNAGDQLILLAPDGSTMHAVAYDISWYRNAVKAEGGWSLEMIDSRYPCVGAANWQASIHPQGGSPGQTNPASKSNADTRPPQLLYAFTNEAQSAILTFDEPVDSTEASNILHYKLSDGIAVAAAFPQPPFFMTVQLQLANSLVAGRLYTVTASHLTDCSGNSIDHGHASTPLGLASAADSSDIVINEILFNPRPQEVDYIELYNRSHKVLNLRQLVLANRSSTTGQLGAFTALSATDRPIYPGTHIVFTENTGVLQRGYVVLNQHELVQLPALPSFPDDKGHAVVLNEQGQVIDELGYDSRWHFALIDNEEGVALERIDPDGPTQHRDNWTSAASSAQYGTPTSRNSQYKTSGQPTAAITINPNMFSPDNDGFEDYTMIAFRFPQPGYVANITILDGAGRSVRILQRNATCGSTGSFRWDGLNDKQQQAPVGTYVVFTEIFDLTGRKQAFKNSVTIARKF